MLSSSCRIVLKKVVGQSSAPRHFSSTSWSGPRSLDDIVKKELLVGKSSEEVADIWLKYHEEKVGIFSVVSFVMTAQLYHSL
jgi:hypothetical protein